MILKTKRHGEGRKFAVLGIVMLAVFLIYFATGEAEAAVINVSNDTANIQDFLHNSSNGDVINFSAGIYRDKQWVINKSLTLVSDTGDYRTSGVVFTGEVMLRVSSANVTIKGFVFDNTTNVSQTIHSTIYDDLNLSPNVRIEKNKFVNTTSDIRDRFLIFSSISNNLSVVDNYFVNAIGRGDALNSSHFPSLYSERSNGVLIEGNVFENVFRGSRFSAVRNLNILNNRFNNSQGSTGLGGIEILSDVFYSDSINMIKGNVIQNFGGDIRPISQSYQHIYGAITIHENRDHDLHGVIENNTITGNHDGIVVCKSCNASNSSRWVYQPQQFNNDLVKYNYLVIRNNSIYSNSGSYDIVNAKDPTRFNNFDASLTYMDASHNYFGGPYNLNLSRFFGKVNYTPFYSDASFSSFAVTENGTCDDTLQDGCITGGWRDIDDAEGFYNWSCLGLYGGTDNLTCSLHKPVNGACDNTQRNGCSAGDDNDTAVDDSNSHYKWICEGQHGGRDSRVCSLGIPVNGACDNTQRNGCSAGDDNDTAVDDDQTHYKWSCMGRYGGTDATTCNFEKPVNGVCNVSTQNGCVDGTANDTAVDDSNSHYKWICEGQHGGRDSRVCSLGIPVNGACDNTQRNKCSAGDPNDTAVDDDQTHYKWSCMGRYGGTDATTCNFEKPVNGVCNVSTQNGCVDGTANDTAVDDDQTHYKWICEGQHGGRDSRVCSLGIPVNGACDNTQRNECSAGDPNDTAVDDDQTHYKWSCMGRYGGTDAATCNFEKPVNGACDNTQRNECSAGDDNDTAVDDSNSHYKWICEGQHGGRDSRVCSLGIPVNGACDNTQRNKCSAGDPNDTAEPNNASHYRWRCVGLYGGETVGTCNMMIPSDTEINGTCDTNTQYNCTNGTLNNVNDNSTHYIWQCLGQGSGTSNLTCNLEIPSGTDINGACDNVRRNGCTNGTLNNVDNNDTHYLWQCLGLNDGTNATTCKFHKEINGACDDIHESCITGRLNNTRTDDDNATHYKWQCLGQYGGNDVSCQLNREINGACDTNTQYNCTNGTLNVINSNATHYKWQCLGRHGGTDDLTCNLGIPVNGACGTSTRDSCTTGRLNNTFTTDDTDDHYKWQCLGINGGADVTTCQLNKPVNGACGTSTRDSCITGRLNNSDTSDDTDDHYKWQCLGLYGGNNATTCQLNKPINAACDNVQQEGCITGRLNNSDTSDDTDDHYKWQCLGLYGGNNATTCQLNKPINAACDNVQQEGCITGRLNNSDTSDDTDDHYKWQCLGQYGGNDVSCQLNREINGACDDVHESCITGGLNNTRTDDDNATHYKWQCLGQYGGNDVSCQLNREINGACGSNTQNNCTNGTLNDVNDNATHYKWQCLGRHGGTDNLTCNLEIPSGTDINGACDNVRRNGCTNGTLNNVDNNGTHYLWACMGLNDGTNATTCSLSKLVNAACDNVRRNGCTNGTLNNSDTDDDTDNYYNWQCLGQYDGNNVSCQLNREINGACGGNTQNNCTAGDDNDAAFVDTSSHYKWICMGQHGGRDSRTCSLIIPVNGACGTSTRDSCITGRLNNSDTSDDTDDHYKWQCLGINGGADVTTCQLNKPVNGACDTSTRDTCTTGRLNNSDTSDDTDDHYKWQCLGLYGGNNATTCQLNKPVNGACDTSTRDTCTTGTLNNTRTDDDNITHYKWQCRGRYGGNDVSCDLLRPPVNAACDNVQQNGCTAGILNNSDTDDDTDDRYIWQCLGINGGSDVSCQLYKRVNGACDNTRQNECTAGTLNDVNDNSTHYLWQCIGRHGGTNATTCNILRPPVNAACGSTRNACTLGTSNNPTSNATHYLWQCRGQYNGNNASCDLLIPPINGACDNTRINRCLAGTLNNTPDTSTYYLWRCMGQYGGDSVSCRIVISDDDDDDDGGSSRGSGGSGSGSTTTPVAFSGYKVIGNSFRQSRTLNAGTLSQYDLRNRNLPVLNVEIDMSRTTRDALLVVSNLDPVSTSPPRGKIYKYFGIKLDNVNEANIKQFTVTFGVDGEWMASNNVSNGDVRLLARDGNSWKSLTPEFVKNTAGDSEFSARISKPSVFAITSTTITGTGETTTYISPPEAEEETPENELPYESLIGEEVPIPEELRRTFTLPVVMILSGFLFFIVIILVISGIRRKPRAKKSKRRQKTSMPKEEKTEDGHKLKKEDGLPDGDKKKTGRRRRRSKKKNVEAVRTVRRRLK